MLIFTYHDIIFYCSPLRSPGVDSEVAAMNNVYKERFPKVDYFELNFFKVTNLPFFF